MPNNYVQVVRAVETTFNNSAEIWWCPSVVQYPSGIAFGINIQLTTQSQSIQPLVYLYEVSGLSGTVDSFGSASSTAIVTALTATNSSANTGAKNFVLAGIAWSSGNNTTAPNTPLTVLDINLQPAGGIVAQACHQIDTASGVTDSAAWTWTNGNRCAGVIASFTSGGAAVVQSQPGYSVYSTASIQAGVQATLPQAPTTGNSIIVLFVNGKNPNGATPNQILGMNDTNSFASVAYIV